MSFIDKLNLIILGWWNFGNIGFHFSIINLFVQLRLCISTTILLVLKQFDNISFSLDCPKSIRFIIW